MGTPNGLFAIRYWKGSRDETRGRRRRPRLIGRDARLPLVERARALKCSKRQGLAIGLSWHPFWVGVTFAWDRRRLGSGAATLVITGNTPGNGNNPSPSPSPSRV